MKANQTLMTILGIILVFFPTISLEGFNFISLKPVPETTTEISAKHCHCVLRYLSNKLLLVSQS